MAIPVIINNSVASIGVIITTRITVTTSVLPPSDIVMSLTLGTPFACDVVYLCSILVNGDSGEDNGSCLIEVVDDSSDNDL